MKKKSDLCISALIYARDRQNLTLCDSNFNTPLRSHLFKFEFRIIKMKINVE